MISGGVENDPDDDAGGGDPAVPDRPPAAELPGSVESDDTDGDQLDERSSAREDD